MEEGESIEHSSNKEPTRLEVHREEVDSNSQVHGGGHGGG